jgi:hypothetical protein
VPAASALKVADATRAMPAMSMKRLARIGCLRIQEEASTLALPRAAVPQSNDSA